MLESGSGALKKAEPAWFANLFAVLMLTFHFMSSEKRVSDVKSLCWKKTYSLLSYSLV